MPEQPRTVHLLAGKARRAYEECLILEGIPSKQHSYYVLRVNQFIKASNGCAPVHLQPDQITGILGQLGRDGKLADWQFIQLTNAVRILLRRYLATKASEKVDWSYWEASAKSVSSDHSTTARQNTPDQLAYLKISRGTGKLAETRRQHRPLLIRLVTEIRARGYAYRTEEAYEQWAVRYIAFCNGESPENTGADHVANYLNNLVISGNVSASTQNQALNALIFLYKHVLNAPLGKLESFARSKRKKVVPVVMSRDEVKALLAALNGWQLHVGSLLYGTGMRVMVAKPATAKHHSRRHSRKSILEPRKSFAGNFSTPQAGSA